MPVGILDATGKPIRKAQAMRKRAAIMARYDAARTNDENKRHWANADALSADAAMSASVRQTLRQRARYEVANNSYAKGMALTLANDCVGTGPNLNVRLEDTAADERIEADWQDWAREVDLAGKLRTARMARATDGEGFGLMVTNRRVSHPVKMDLRLIEADQVTSPSLGTQKLNETDGIELDEYGNPARYVVRRNHPGALNWTGSESYDRYPAEAVVHLFRRDRPGQHRGVPEITPALPLFALLRRYTLAVVTAAEVAATIGGVLETDAGAEEVSPDNAEDDVFDLLNIERNMLMTLPGGYKLSQYKAEQPTATHEMFKRAIISEIARCLNMPYNIAAGDSSSYNYASGRLDHQTYFKAIDVDRSEIERHALEPVFRAWLREYVLVADWQVPLDGVNPRLPHEWAWPGREHVDPVKEATAQSVRLANKTTTYAAEYAREGKDWEEEFRQRKRENDLLEELGMTEREAQGDKLAAKLAEIFAGAAD